MPPMGIRDVLAVCRSGIPGWEHLSDTDIVIKPLTGGLTNIIYKADADKAENIKKVVVRIYGEGIEDIIDSKNERYIARQLGERGLGPAIYYEFTTPKLGRIEEFLPGHVLRYEDMMVPNSSILIADFIAGTHNVEMKELSRSPSCFPLLKKYYQGALKVKTLKDKAKQPILDALNLDTQEFRKDLEWLENYAKKFNSPVVFCHNDVNEGNIIAFEEKNSITISVIDYEYGGYNYRGYDIANYLCESYIKNNDEKSADGYSINAHQFPTKTFRHQFLQRYLDKTGSNTSVQDLDDEVVAFMLASHLTWVCWAVMQAARSNISWGFIQYARDRLNEYKRQKHLMINTTSKEFRVIQSKL